MSSKHNILYVMRSVHIDSRIFVDDKKVGVTGKGSATLRDRISQLSSTKNNFGAQCIAAWKVPETDENSALFYESELHKILQSQMVPCASGAKTEWFYDDGEEQLDLVQSVSDMAENWKLDVVNVASLQDQNTKALANKVTKASYANVYSLVKTFSSAHFSSHNLTKDCVRITTEDKRSFHINVRADLNKQYISISKTKHDYERFKALCIENSFKYEISKKSGNIRVYVKTPRAMAKAIDAFTSEGV